ncbi:hypothetical protein QFC24_006730 [Naganishia onofrii]|uniref:Uncharacterized protein n=1 Tax=Naganishia onofrii TaxID=1851511 RepID=A0ACC2WXQ4_9TREE|nr:hypothetical protein QFC24_006730 [Naganishia onofrii]
MLVAALTPLTVLLGGFLLDRRLTLLQQEQWGRQKVIERRIKAYDELAPQLNELYCYFCYVGTWKKLDPPQVVEMKRQLDRNAYISAPLFDESFLPKYNLLLEKCFATFGSWPDDAKLRVFSDRRVLAAGTAWQTQWNRCFTSPSEFVDPHQVQAAYVQVMHYLAHAIGIHEVSSQQLGSTPIHSLEETDSPRDLQKGIVSDIGQAGSASTITPYHGPEAVT